LCIRDRVISSKNLVICTLDSIDSIKSLKRSPQHIFVEVQVPGSNFRFQVPSSGLSHGVSEFSLRLYSML
ncbi:hypothetical protein Avbf_18629, partial [Armadillidium vulgare]